MSKTVRYICVCVENIYSFQVVRRLVDAAIETADKYEHITLSRESRVESNPLYNAACDGRLDVLKYLLEGLTFVTADGSAVPADFSAYTNAIMGAVDAGIVGCRYFLTPM